MSSNALSHAVMPYGTFTGHKISSLPARYLYHLWTNGQFREKDNPSSVVHIYIKANLKKLKKQHPGNW